MARTPSSKARAARKAPGDGAARNARRGNTRADAQRAGAAVSPGRSASRKPTTARSSGSRTGAAAGRSATLSRATTGPFATDSKGAGAGRRAKTTLMVDRSKLEQLLHLTGETSVSAAVDIALTEVLRIARLRHDVAAYAAVPPAEDEIALASLPADWTHLADDTEWAALYPEQDEQLDQAGADS